MCVECEAVPLQEDSERLGGRDQSGTVQAGRVGLLRHLFRSLGLCFRASLSLSRRENCSLLQE